MELHMTSINTGGAGTRGQPISFFSVFVLIIICFLQKKKEQKKEKAHLSSSSDVVSAALYSCTQPSN